MLECVQQSCPRSRRSHLIASKLAALDAAMDRFDDRAYNAFYLSMMFVDLHERMPKENIPMTLQSEISDKPKTRHEQIMEVLAAEEHRFDACIEGRQRGVKSTVGGIPAGYADDQPGLNFVRRRSALRQRAEDAS